MSYNSKITLKTKGIPRKEKPTTQPILVLIMCHIIHYVYSMHYKQKLVCGHHSGQYLKTQNFQGLTWEGNVSLWSSYLSASLCGTFCPYSASIGPPPQGGFGTQGLIEGGGGIISTIWLKIIPLIGNSFSSIYSQERRNKRSNFFWGAVSWKRLIFG